jgi:hypothetical protein
MERCSHAIAVALWRIVGALLIGVATIFVMKHDPREHWAIPPTSKLVLVLDDSTSQDSLDLDAWRFVVREGLRWPRDLIGA